MINGLYGNQCICHPLVLLILFNNSYENQNPVISSCILQKRYEKRLVLNKLTNALFDHDNNFYNFYFLFKGKGETQPEASSKKIKKNSVEE